MTWRVVHADCIEALEALEDASIDSIVTDPPYGIEFMGRDWDRLKLSDNESGPQSEMWHDNGGANPYARRATPRFAGKVLGSKVAQGREMQEWHERWAREALRVLKPGGHLLAFGGTRTSHRLACAVEDAGFEIRDGIVWLYGSGFPKSLNVSKAIDKAAGAEREVVGQRTDGRYAHGFSDDAKRALGGVVASEDPTGFSGEMGQVTRPATPEAEQWDGWGTALKPSHEPIVVARKPMAGTVAGNVLAHGTGGLNVDGCRIEGVADAPGSTPPSSVGGQRGAMAGAMDRVEYDPTRGRWPANVLLSHAEDCVQVDTRQVSSDGHFPAARGASGYGSNVQDSNGGGLKGQEGLEERYFAGEIVERWACVPGCPVRELDTQSGATGAAAPVRGTEASRTGQNGIYGYFERVPGAFHGDTGGASRFFYCAKVSRAERNAGLDTFDKKPILWSSGEQNPGSFQAEGTDRAARNPHPTVKPIELMRWLVRLVTPPGGIVLDPFVGSGSTACAAVLEGFEFVGVEREADYVAIARARIGWWEQHPRGLSLAEGLEAEGRRRKVAGGGQLSLMEAL